VSLELVLATPLLGLLILLAVQFAVWQHAQHVAQAAAGQGLAAARVRGGTSAAGRAEADRVLQTLGGRVLHGVRVTVDRHGGSVRVEVSGVAEAVLPGLRLPVHAVAAGPAEVFRPAAGFGVRDGLVDAEPSGGGGR
jgi:hypothetical protein